MNMPAATPAPTMDVDIVTESNRPWQHIVWGDQINSISYVTYAFQMLFGMDRKKAHALMVTIHTEGEAIVSSGERDKVEADVRKLHRAGLWATMEQANQADIRQREGIHMCPWKHKRLFLGGGVKCITAFEGTKRDLLLSLVATMADSLMERAQSAPKDELAEMTGMPVGHSGIPSDPEPARLLPDFTKPSEESMEGESAFMRQLYESEIVGSKFCSLHAITDTLEPAESGQVSISESNAHAWVAGTNDLHIYLRVSTENLSSSIEQIEQTDAMYQWLSYNRESLLDQLIGEQRIRAKPRRMQ